jgi:long-chain acyl-CoA synthetase
MVVVPQVLELFWTAIQREIDRRGRGRAVARLRALARHLPFGLRRLLFGPVHAQLGGGLTLFVCAAAFLPPALQQAWEELGVAVMQGYGATECGFAVAHSPDDHHLGTVGRPMPPSRVRIDPASGEIQVSGPTVFQGYWRDAQATAAALGDDGWYHTGDVGHWDRSGYLVLSGRIKDMIVLPNGFNVYPEDIENALREAGLRDTVVLETAPGRIEAVVLPPDAWAIAEDVSPPPGPTRRPEEGVELRRQIDAAVRTANARLDAQQRVAAWRLWPGADFPRTHTLKVKRDLVRAWVSADAPSSAIS